MSTALTFAMTGESELSQSFLRYAGDIKDAAEPFNEIADDFKQIEQRQFDSEGSGAWPALSPTYAAWKARNYPGAGLLVRTGLLKESLAGQNSGTVREVRALQMILGTRVSYALRHQFGIGVPERKVIDITGADKQRWTAILQKWILKTQNGDFSS